MARGCVYMRLHDKNTTSTFNSNTGLSLTLVYSSTNMSKSVWTSGFWKPLVHKNMSNFWNNIFHKFSIPKSNFGRQENEEWPMLKTAVLEAFLVSSDTTWLQVNRRFRNEYPHVLNFFYLILTIPTTSAACEWGFTHEACQVSTKVLTQRKYSV